MLGKSTSRQHLHKAQWIERATRSRRMLVKYPSRMKGVDVEDETWSGGTELSLDRVQGHEPFIFGAMQDEFAQRHELL
ncbi:hypothetical protein BHM03_00010668 [Ensete ventricosum]|nr:hypothetical protein BHM03_00010668 [Ensete ventricosum]